MSHAQTLILDNGAYSIKAGLQDQEPRIIPNCITRLLLET